MRALLIIVGLLLLARISISGESAEWCDQQWVRVSAARSSGAEQDYAGLLAEWRTFEEKCAGTGIYEARLATVYVLLGQYSKAREALDPVLRNEKLPAGYRAMVEMVRLNADWREAHAGTQPDRKRLQALEQRVARLIEQHPNYPPFYLFLGNLRLELGDYRGAIEPLGKMSQFEDGNRWDVYRSLTIAYANAGDYKAALRSADRTYALNKTVSSHEEFMYACAIAYAATGNIDAAKDTLTLILNKKPQLKNDPRFQQTVRKAKQLSGDMLK